MAIGSKRERYVYNDDLDNNWIVHLAVDKVAGVIPAVGLTVYNPTSPPTNFRGRINPKNCRRVYAYRAPLAAGGTELKREFICNQDSALYIRDHSGDLTYAPEDEAATITMTTTGRRGEKISF